MAAFSPLGIAPSSCSILPMIAGVA